MHGSGFASSIVWSPGSKQLRRILKKCISIDADLGQDQWGGFYDGTNARPLSEREIQYREMILDASMDLNEANNLLEGLDTNVPFAERLEFIKCLAALCRRHPAEVTRKIAGANKQISKILWSACAPDRLEWLMNNLRVRHALPSSYQPFCQAEPLVTRHCMQRSTHGPAASTPCTAPLLL